MAQAIASSAWNVPWCVQMKAPRPSGSFACTGVASSLASSASAESGA
eukprot:CAMPEP_0168374632 /NCGR_PEP_ID=MMETSP0228-20121227/9400_1 /TAXON_ID=133427 /ORGANISM="Protoceratium reticulatum, Strain CCCM 535 (=CCMP 1889)" /LENGTH=46 /DNA_ID= /DNA_START= /DNA_END= /DNA_ORIENTATION=